MKLSGKTVAMLAENLYQEMEVWYPIYRMREEGAKVIVVGTGSAASYTSKHGYPVKVDKPADDVNPRELDALIPGGYAPDILRRYPAVLSLVKAVFDAGKPVAAICHGGWVLASANVLRGRKATSFFAIRDDMTNAGASYQDVEVVVDGNLITSRTPDDLPAFCREIIRALAS
ncbi:MAG: type 1 glutamine amidotransferase domain-containing protein [Acidobacteriota bacterium]